MGKISAKMSCCLRDIPLGVAFAVLVVIFALVDIVLVRQTASWANGQQSEIQMKYDQMSDEIQYDESGESGEAGIAEEDVSNENWIVIEMYKPAYTDEDAAALERYRQIAMYASVFWSSICLCCCAALYYFLMLHRPLDVLNVAIQKITDNNLDFTIAYDGKNELARVCSSVEKMRGALRENTQEMVALAEERKRLNDAYTHEMRNPVAVLRGNMEMIADYLPREQMTEDELLAKIQTMQHNVARIEAFLESMNQIQKIEDMPIKREKTNAARFFAILKSSVEILCEADDIALGFDNQVEQEEVAIDASAVLQVMENITGNAIRYAWDHIWISCQTEGSLLIIRVTDNGCGFSEAALRKAAQCYYTGANEEKEHHFGLGLYISTMICEKHGGKLEISNTAVGASVVARFCIT